MEKPERADTIYDASPGLGMEGTEPAERRLGFLLVIGLLYISFGAIFGILQGGLQPILRAQGVTVGSLGLLGALLLPFGLTFLWAPLVDRVTIHPRAPRIAWIIVTQTIVVGLLVIVAFVGGTTLPLVFALALAIAFAAATMDIALDALASKTVQPSDRVTAGGIKVGSLALGSIIGGGLFVALFHRLGWTNIFLSVAILTTVTTLPILTQVRRDAPSRSNEGGKNPSILDLLRKPDQRKRLFLLATISVPIVMLFGLNRVMLVDAGLDLQQIGIIAGTLSPIGSLAATALAMLVMRRLGPKASLAAFVVVCIVAAGLVIAGFRLDGRSDLAMAGAIAATAASSGFYVVICAVVLGWANTAQPATDYAALYGISRLCALVVLMAAAQVVPLVGWPAFYLVTALLLVAAVVPLARSGLEQASAE
ncbi:MFS transporter [Shinella sp. BYT-45]|uniref:MFS transporter n=1 Tax=Shinella sp. BYT-45 TaxID=3377377 RepID=UPI00398018C6